jgi:hypothetical protein
LFFEQLSGESEILDGFNNATPIGDFARHELVYTTVLDGYQNILSADLRG